MVRIVSGTQQEDPNAPLLAGMQLGQAWRQAQQSRAQEQRAEQDQLMQMQQIQMKFQDARAKREEMLNQAAQMGDAQALQEMALRQKLSPSQSMAQDGMKMLEGIKNPKARALALPAIQQIIQSTQHQEQIQAAEGEIDRAAKDGLLDEAGVLASKSQLQAGKAPGEIIGPIMAARKERHEAGAAMAENSKAMEQTRAMIDAAPPGPDRQRAEILWQEWEQSPSLQEKPGAGPEQAARIQNELVKSRSQQVARYVALHKDKEYAKNLKALLNGTDEQFGEKAFMASNETMRRLQERFAGAPDQESTSAMTQHVKKQRAEKEKRYPGSTAKRSAAAPSGLPPEIMSAKSEDEVIGILERAGMLDEASVDAAREAWQGRGK